MNVTLVDELSYLLSLASVIDIKDLVDTIIKHVIVLRGNLLK